MVVDNVDIGIRQRAMRRRRTADAIRYPSMERALAIAFTDEALERLNGPEGPIAVPNETVPVAQPAATAAPMADEEPSSVPWHSLVAASVVAPWYLLNALQQWSERQRDNEREDVD
jgi:hypothetical protein